MPRSYKLTWQEGTGKRAGRWKRKYKGKAYYFPGGRGKSDQEAYKAALLAWERRKLQIDAESPKKHQAEYEAEILKWEAVLDWSRVHREPDPAEVATKQIADLQKALAATKPKPVRYENTFAAWFDESVQNPSLFRAREEIGNLVQSINTFRPPSESLNGNRVSAARSPDKQSTKWPGLEQGSESMVYPDRRDSFLGASELEAKKRIWEDRLAVMRNSAADTERSLSAYRKKFLAQKRAAAEAGTISAGRFGNISKTINDFGRWRGNSASIDEVNGRMLSDYFDELQQKVVSKGMSPRTAKDHLASVKQFIKWLWHMEAIQSLPRNIDSRSLAFDTQGPSVVVFEIKEIEKLLRKAADRMRLYILLMLNCGMTQKDIADLVHDEVDWDSGRIVRRRSKTRKSTGVPVVHYALWPETLGLLRSERTESNSGRVLVNRSGAPLWQESILEEGKTRKKDNIRSAFRRTQEKAGVNKPLKSLKKTSASLIRGNPKYTGLEGLFLGHAPKSMSDRHYTLPPQQLLDEAIGWLQSQLEIERIFNDLAMSG